MRTEESISNEICSIISDLLKGSIIDPKRDLAEQGIHSLLAMNVLVAVEDHFFICFDDEDLTMSNFTTVERICQMVIDKLAAKS